MYSRREFIKAVSLFGGAAATLRFNPLLANTAMPMFMPDESAPHKRTWMAFVARPEIWSKQQVPRVKKDLALIANTIAKYEPVSILVSPYDIDDAESLLNIGSAAHPIELHPFEVDDLWLRDTGPTFVATSNRERRAIDFNFNGWGNKQDHKRDKKVAGFIAKASGARLEKSSLVLEGGCFEVDGHGTAIMTKSCIVNDNRNPGVSFKEIESELKAKLGLRKIIWLEGVKGKDITDGHTDFYARFIRPGQVMVSRDNYRESFDYDITRENIAQLAASTDADGNKLELTIIDTPDRINERYGVSSFAAGYIGYYVCNGAIIAQKFGDSSADQKARDILAAAFPERAIEQLAIDGIASGGGSIHCATQQEILT